LENGLILGSANPAPGNYAGNAGWPSYATGFAGERATPGMFNGVIGLHHPSKNIAWHDDGKIGIRSIFDGTSNTAMISERLVQAGNSSSEINNGDRRMQSQHVLERYETLAKIDQQLDSSHTHVFESAHIGRAWASGFAMTAPTYLHVKSPNTVIGHYRTSQNQGDFVATPSSQHEGGVNLAKCDGSTTFVANDIDQHLWWALGGRDDGYVISKLD
jgi:hypothetical protein